MASEIIMPQMGYDMKEGKVVRWLKTEGDTIERGEIIAEIETDKAVVEMEAYAEGLLRSIITKEGDSVPVGSVIGYIGTADEVIPEPDTKVVSSDASSGSDPEEQESTPSQTTDTPTTSSEVRASPIAKKLAKDLNIDLSTVKGTGPGNRITKEDVLAAKDSAASAISEQSVSKGHDSGGHLPVGSEKELSKMRLAVAKVTTQSKQEIPHFYVSVDIDMSHSVETRKQLNEKLAGQVKVSINDLIVKACAQALKKYPSFNSVYVDGKIKTAADINIGIAIALEQGLIMPAITNCQNKSIPEIAIASKDLIDRANQGVLKGDEYTSGTFSVSNLGMFDVDNFIAIIYPGQSAVLAVGTIRSKPVVENNQIMIRSIMHATVSVDHRVSDGAEAAKFIGEVKYYLENPISLMLD